MYPSAVVVCKRGVEVSLTRVQIPADSVLCYRFWRQSLIMSSSPIQCLKCGDTVVSIAAIKTGTLGSISGRCSFVLQVLKTELSWVSVLLLIFLLFATASIPILVRNVIHYVAVLLPSHHLQVHKIFHYVPETHLPPPHQQPFFRTFKKSTAPYKVHNMGLRYIKFLLSVPISVPYTSK